jgi:hypothetical protein
VRSPQRVAGAVVDLLRKDAFDLLWLTYASAHKAGHHLWDAASIADGAIAPEASRELREGLETVYVAIDRAMSRVLDALPQHADVIAFSPTGMGAESQPCRPAPWHARRRADRRCADPEPRAAHRARDLVVARVPVKWRSWIASALPDDVAANLATRLYLQADWSRTRAMAVPGENQGYVRLNLRGREREGCVDPVDADALLAMIAEALMTFRDPDGLPSISKVERMTDLAQRPSAPGLPDLVVTWSTIDRGASLSEVARRAGALRGEDPAAVDPATTRTTPGRSSCRAVRAGATGARGSPTSAPPCAAARRRSRRARRARSSSRVDSPRCGRQACRHPGHADRGGDPRACCGMRIRPSGPEYRSCARRVVAHEASLDSS